MPGNNRNRRNNRNRKKRKQYGFYFDYTLLFVLVFIVGFGLTMIYSTSSYTAQIEEGDPEFYFRKQLIFTIIGFALMIVETKILDYHYLKKLAVVIYIGGLLCMFLLKNYKKWSYQMDKDSGFGTISACGACKDWNDCHDCTSYSESRAEHKEIQDCYSDMYNSRFCTGTACLCAVF